VVIDNCEYVLYSSWGGGHKGYGYLAHKGDCNNPIHEHNK
jgi:hypothetical protein